MKGYNCAKAFQVFRIEYLQWITNPKMLVFFVLLVFIRELIVIPIITAADTMGQPINILEPCIAVGNSGIVLLFLPVFFIMLMSDYPKLNNNMYYFIPRVSRMNWFAGQLFFQIATTFSYLLAIIVSTLLQVASRAYTVNGWSLVTTEYDHSPYSSGGGVMGYLIPLNLFYQMTPLKAFVNTYILLFFYLFLWASLMMLGFMYGKKAWSFFVSITMIAVGMGFAALKSPYMWYFPSGHAILWLHCQKYYRQYLFPPQISLLLLCLGSVAIIFIAARKFTRVNLDTIMEN